MGRLVLGRGMAAEVLEQVRALARPHIPAAVETLVMVMRDPDSRQRVMAAKALIELSVVGLEDAPGMNADASVTRIVLVDSHAMSQVEQKQREVVQARVMEQKRAQGRLG